MPHGFGNLVSIGCLKLTRKLDISASLLFVCPRHWYLSSAKIKCSYFHRIFKFSLSLFSFLELLSNFFISLLPLDLGEIQHMGLG